MKTVKLLSFVAGIALLFFACSKGAPGIQGTTGVTGPIGKSGYANVKIHVYTVSNFDWIENGRQNEFYTNDTATSSLTDTVNETVTVFFSSNSAAGPWTAMPCLNALNTGDTLTYIWSPLAIQFVYKYMNPTAQAPAQPMFFNLAVIPPAIIKRHPNINWKDWNSMMTLPEMQMAMQAKNE